jgi:hypothetical protein
VQPERDGQHQRKSCERRDQRGEREQQQEEQRRGEAAAAQMEASLDSNPDRRVREQVDRAPAAQRERDDPVELVADVTEMVFIANAKNTIPTMSGKCAYAYTSRASATRSGPRRSASSLAPRIEKKSK